MTANTRKNLVLLRGGVVLLAGIGGAVFYYVRVLPALLTKNEAAVKAYLDLINELASALESAKDQESAREAAVRLEKVWERLEEQEKRVKSLPEISTVERMCINIKYFRQYQALDDRKMKLSNRAEITLSEPSLLAARKRFHRLAGNAAVEINRLLGHDEPPPPPAR
jgi:hypothetical protein